MPKGIPDTSPRFSLDWSPKKNFWDKVGGLPKYIASVATALIQDRGMDRGRAIATAKNRVEHWCTTGHDNNLKGNPPVSKAVQAAACAAIAEWKTKLARAKTKKLLSEEEIALLAEEFEPFECPTQFGDEKEGALGFEELLERIKTEDFDEKTDKNLSKTSRNTEIIPNNAQNVDSEVQETQETLIERINKGFRELQSATVDAVGRVWRSGDHPRGAGGTFSPTADDAKPQDRADLIKQLFDQVDLGELAKYKGTLINAALNAAKTGELDSGTFSSLPDNLQQQAVQVVASVLEGAGLKKKEQMGEGSSEEDTKGIQERIAQGTYEGWEVVVSDPNKFTFTGTIPTELEEFTDKPWNGSASRFKDTNDYCRSCLIDENEPGSDKVQGKCHLPIREPNGGPVNKAALRNAAARLNQVQASASSKKSARSRLSSLMSSAGIQTQMGEPLYQLPINLSEPEETNGLWRKALVPVGKKILKGGKPLDFSLGTLQKMVDNFKAKAYDQVPLLNGHTDSVDAYLGELVDLELDDNWLWGIFKPSEKGVEILKDNPKLPTSAGFWEDYTRPADNKHFGPTLQHVAAIFRPHVPGLGKWEPVQLDSDEADVVDLTGEDFTPPGLPGSGPTQDERKESDPVSDVTETTETKEEEVMETVQSPDSGTEETRHKETPNVVSLEEFNSLKEQFEQKLEDERKERARTSKTLRRQGIRKMLNEEYVANGVPAAKTDAAFILLSSKDELVTLSEDGDASVGDSEQAKAIIELLEGYKGAVEFGEKGTSEDSDADSSDASHQKILALSEEKDISYREAMNILAQRGEVTI